MKSYKEFGVDYNGDDFGVYWVELVDGSNVNLYSDTDTCVSTTKIVTKNKEKNVSEIYNEIKSNPFQAMDTKGYITLAKKPDDLEVLSFNQKTLKPEFKNVKMIWKYKTKRKMYKLKFQDKEIECTENHSIIISRNGEILKVKLKDIQKTDKIIYLEKEK